jgi:hypothetical protein
MSSQEGHVTGGRISFCIARAMGRFEHVSLRAA